MQVLAYILLAYLAAVIAAGWISVATVDQHS